jgi:hypothetical protein
VRHELRAREPGAFSNRKRPSASDSVASCLFLPGLRGVGAARGSARGKLGGDRELDAGAGERAPPVSSRTTPPSVDRAARPRPRAGPPAARARDPVRSPAPVRVSPRRGLTTVPARSGSANSPFASLWHGCGRVVTANPTQTPTSARPLASRTRPPRRPATSGAEERGEGNRRGRRQRLRRPTSLRARPDDADAALIGAGEPGPTSPVTACRVCERKRNSALEDTTRTAAPIASAEPESSVPEPPILAASGNIAASHASRPPGRRSSSSRRSAIPRFRRVFTVFTGTPSRVAILRGGRPSK